MDALAASCWEHLGGETRAAAQRAGKDYEARLRAAGRAYAGIVAPKRLDELVADAIGRASSTGPRALA